MSTARGPSRGRPLALAALAAAAATLAAAPGALAAKLHGPVFTTTKPAGWHTHRKLTPVKGTKVVDTDYSLSSSGSLDRWGIPPSGQFGITIDTLPIAGLKQNVAGVRNASPGTLLDDIVDVPTVAQLVLVQSHRHPTMLGGVAAATISYAYYYAGRVSYQHDIVTRKGSTVVFVELDTNFDVRKAGNRALATVVKNWRWH